MADNLAGLVKRLETAVVSMEKIIGSGHLPSENPIEESKSIAVSVSPIVAQYESSILSKFAAINGFAAKIDPQITALVEFT